MVLVTPPVSAVMRKPWSQYIAPRSIQSVARRTVCSGFRMAAMSYWNSVAWPDQVISSAALVQSAPKPSSTSTGVSTRKELYWPVAIWVNQLFASSVAVTAAELPSQSRMKSPNCFCGRKSPKLSARRRTWQLIGPPVSAACVLDRNWIVPSTQAQSTAMEFGVSCW